MASDVILLNYVQQLIKQGHKQIELPINLVTEASQEAVNEVRQLCKLCGVKIVTITDR